MSVTLDLRETTELERLRNENSRLEWFISALTHDLRTPLSAASLSAGLLARIANNPDEVRRVSARIHANLERVDGMIRDLLDANRFKAGAEPLLRFEDCELNEIAADAIEEMKAIHGDRFVLHSSSAIEGHWCRDGVLRIFENLCANAVKYGAANQPVTITLGRNMDETSAWLRVHNEGAPILQEEQMELFRPFRRSRATSGATPKGWGLGLTLVKGFAEAHGGTVSLRSHESSGTTFEVRLPLNTRGT